MGQKGMGRRDFLKSSAAGLGGFVYLSANEKGSPEKGQEKTGGKITYRWNVSERIQNIVRLRKVPSEFIA